MLNSNHMVFANNSSLFHANGRNDLNKITMPKIMTQNAPECTILRLQCYFLGRDTPGPMCERSDPLSHSSQAKTGASIPVPYLRLSAIRSHSSKQDASFTKLMECNLCTS